MDQDADTDFGEESDLALEVRLVADCFEKIVRQIEDRKMPLYKKYLQELLKQCQ